jgi:hypothetical protein
MGCLEHRLDLRSRIGEDLRIGIGGGAGGVARVAEQVGGAPEQADAGPVHVRLQLVDHGQEVHGRLGEGLPLGHKVAVVEAEIRGPELLEELEGGISLRPRRDQGIEARVEPGAIERSAAEDIAARPVEGVPAADRDAQVVRHPLSQDHPIGLVNLEGERIIGADAAEGDRAMHVREEVLAHRDASEWEHRA